MNEEETTEILYWIEKYVQCFKLLLQIDMSSVILVVNVHWDNYQKETYFFIEVAFVNKILKKGCLNSGFSM